MNKDSALLKLFKEGYRFYIATQPMILRELSVNKNLEPYCQFFDCLLEENRDWYKNKVSELNKRIFGPLAMPTDYWVDHHFGIAAGVTLGFLDSAGEPISIMRFVRRFEEDSIHEWTMLVDTKYEGRGFGRATLALGCELSRNKKRISFTTQLDNKAIGLYLGLANEGEPLKLLAIGFHHTHPNSILAIGEIPGESDSIMREYQMPPINEGLLLKKDSVLAPGKYLIRASDLETIRDISQDLKNNAEYFLIGWYPNHLGLKIEEPLVMIKKIK